MFYPKLTEADLVSHEMNPRVLTYLERYCEQHGFDRQHVRILDWGCGRGQSVMKLCEQGYAAVGVDIDPDRFSKMQAAAMAKDWSWDRSAERYLAMYRELA